MDMYPRSYDLPSGNGLTARLRYRLDRLGWFLSFSWDRGPCKVKLDVPEPRPGERSVVVMARVSRIFASKIDHFLEPFDRELRMDIAFAVGAIIFAACAFFGASVEGLVAGGAIAIFLQMLFTGCK